MSMATNRTVRTALLVTLLIASGVFCAYESMQLNGHLQFGWRVLVAVCSFLIGPAVLIVPIVLVGGWLKIRALNQDAAEMDDTLTVNPDGEGKLRDFIALRTSLESRMGFGEFLREADRSNVLRDLPEEDPRGKPRE